MGLAIWCLGHQGRGVIPVLAFWLGILGLELSTRVRAQAQSFTVWGLDSCAWVVFVVLGLEFRFRACGLRVGS